MIGINLGVFLLVFVQRFFYKELFAFLYAGLVLGGSICAMMVVVAHSPSPGSFLIVYLFAFTAAMSVKLFWLCCADFGPTSPMRLEEQPLLDSKIRLFILTGLVLLVNLIGFAIQLYILTSTYEEL